MGFILTGTSPEIVWGEAPTKLSRRTLTFAERIAYQRAIEDVYWRYRIWPKERPDPKPLFDAVMSQAQLERKVIDYLRKSQALEDHWQRPITAEQLQAEMDRMAKHTKQPEVLRELFAALGDDPFVIAECLARPALAERLLTNWYAHDQQIHGQLKQRIQTDLVAHPSVEQMKQLSGNYSEIELIRTESPHEENRRAVGHRVQLNSREWDEMVQNLTAMFNKGTAKASAVGVRRDLAARKSDDMSAHAKNTSRQRYETIPVGKLTSLQVEEGRYYVTAVIGKSNDYLKLAAVSWFKEPLEVWLSRAENRLMGGLTAPTAGYELSKISDGAGCIDDTWTPTSGPPRPRAGQTVVWTGSEMIIWGGGISSFGPFFNTGSRYNPITDSWSATSTINAPSARGYHTAVWTGGEMIVWGGEDGSGTFFNTGGRYNPITDSWSATGTSNAPSARWYHTAVWTGTEMIVWGGYDSSSTPLNTGSRYNPGADSWTATSTTNAPDARAGHTAVWSGTEMIVWGGFAVDNTGGRYNPITDSWSATSTSNAPSAREYHTAVWTDSEMIIWGGYDGSDLNTGGRYNPGTDSWTSTTTSNAPEPRDSHTAVWTGSEMIVWGGEDINALNTGARYNPGTDSWTATSTTNAPDARAGHTAVWTGTEMIVWGGDGSGGFFNTGGRYNPSTDSWSATSTSNVPDARAHQTAVWTGSEMIVWGGNNLIDGDLNTGGRYNPATDSWAATSTTDAPDARFYHTSVWTGTEMIVWGGYNFNDGEVNTGGRYNPVTDSWVATSTTDAPFRRELHTAVWADSRMVVWGGYYTDPNTHLLNTGGNYDPVTNSWTATTTVAAPSARASHGAVWTGNEMIVWGGFDDTGYVNTGGRYDPNTNSWTATTTTNAPSARTVYGTVWTGSEMLVWGGYFSDGLNDYYLNTGGRYDPGTDNWTATSTGNAPDGRTSHTAVWTGNEMIVWGGQAGAIGHYFNTGGRYDPSTNTWTTTSTDNVPDGRYRHTAVWTGNEMIVWGGILYSNSYTSSGGRYCAQTGPPPTPTPTPTPCTGRCTPTPRPRPDPAPRP
jgi:N-acetylneuraminic acid mutarotase